MAIVLSVPVTVLASLEGVFESFGTVTLSFSDIVKHNIQCKYYLMIFIPLEVVTAKQMDLYKYTFISAITMAYRYLAPF